MTESYKNKIQKDMKKYINKVLLTRNTVVERHFTQTLNSSQNIDNTSQDFTFITFTDNTEIPIGITMTIKKCINITILKAINSKLIHMRHNIHKKSIYKRPIKYEVTNKRTLNNFTKEQT